MGKNLGLILIFSGFILPLCRAQTPYNLSGALQKALSSNIELKSQGRHIQVAEAEVITSGLRPNPILNNQSLQLMQPAYFPANANWNDGRNRQVWWQMTKPFLLPGVRKNRIEFATFAVRQEEYVYQNIEREFLFQVANKWIDAWLAYKRTIVLKQSADKELNSKHPSNDLASEIVARQYKLQLRTEEQLLEREIIDLQILLGTTEKITIDTNLLLLRKAFSELDSPGGVDVSVRPDLLYSQKAVEASVVNVKLQRSQALPVPELGLIYNPQNTIPYLGFFGTLQIPLFARNQGEIKKAGVLHLQAAEVMEHQTLKARAELQKAQKTYQACKENLKDYYELLQLSNKSGLQNNTSLNAESEIGQTEYQKQVYEAEADYFRSSIQLLYLSGRLNSTFFK